MKGRLSCLRYNLAAYLVTEVLVKTASVMSGREVIGLVALFSKAFEGNGYRAEF